MYMKKILISIKDFFANAIFEYSIVFLLFLYLVLHDSLGLPTVEALLSFIEYGFEQYGLIFLFIALILEGLIVFGFYFPGSVVAFSAVIFLGDTYTDVFLIILVGSLALIFVNVINYILGRYGYYKILERVGKKGVLERMKKRYDKNHKAVTFFSSFSPNFLAIVSIYAGIVKTPFRYYLGLMSASVVFWVSLVSATIPIAFKDIQFSNESNLGWYSLIITLVWALYESISALKNK